MKALFILSSLARRWAIVPLALVLGVACHRQDEPAEDPVPAVCGECETCNPIPIGSSMLAIGMYGWNHVSLSNPVMRERPCFNPRNPDEVVYHRGPNGTPDAGTWVANLRTGQEHKILPESVRWYLQVKWGAAGWLAFTGSDNQVWKVKANGDSLTQLTFTAAHREPQWSPDGRRLACVQDNGTRFDVVILDLNGRQVQKLTLPGRYAQPLAWAPDGTRLAVWVLGDPDPTAIVRPGIYVYNFQSGNATFLMDGTAPSPSGPQVQGLSWCDWLPDSRTLIWAGSKGLYSTATETSQTTLLHKGCESRSYVGPSVSANGKTLVIERTDYDVTGTPLALYGETNLVLMDPDGRNERKATF